MVGTITFKGDCCGNCLFSRIPKNSPVDAFVECHKGPPQGVMPVQIGGAPSVVVGGQQQQRGFLAGVWGNVALDEWCGDFKSKKSAVMPDGEVQTSGKVKG